MLAGHVPLLHGDHLCGSGAMSKGRGVFCVFVQMSQRVEMISILPILKSIVSMDRQELLISCHSSCDLHLDPFLILFSLSEFSLTSMEDIVRPLLAILVGFNYLRLLMRT